jgi:hypothetical protein
MKDVLCQSRSTQGPNKLLNATHHSFLAFAGIKAAGCLHCQSAHQPNESFLQRLVSSKDLAIHFSCHVPYTEFAHSQADATFAEKYCSLTCHNMLHCQLYCLQLPSLGSRTLSKRIPNNRLEAILSLPHLRLVDPRSCHGRTQRLGPTFTASSSAPGAKLPIRSTMGSTCLRVAVAIYQHDGAASVARNFNDVREVKSFSSRETFSIQQQQDGGVTRAVSVYNERVHGRRRTGAKRSYRIR